MERDDGGPAFPTKPVINAAGEVWRDGMTLRDFLAAAALRGMLAQARPGDGTPQEFAADAYTFADTMLKAWKEGGS